MRKITKIEQKTDALAPRKRVAAYARVSRDTERLMHSASAQVSKYSAMIQKNPEWLYAGVYADYGISGTQVSGRDEFQRMLADCEAGKIDIILTKSISRFARNTVDLLETVRHLKGIGVEVRFEEQHINTFSGDGELMLSILASFAQEESRSISDNCKWGLRKRFQNGTVGRANKHLLGYRYDEQLRQYVIIPDEAEIVRMMFALYMEGVTLRMIADKMNATGFTGTMGGAFQEASVRNMLHNEIYAGDILYQKAYMVDPISKKKVRNNGELPQYYLEDAHEAIIDRDTWMLVQKEHERRAAMMPPLNCFTGKIKCGKCGMPYTRKAGTHKGKRYVHWICRSKKEPGPSCTSRNFSEELLKNICAETLGMDEFEEDVFERTVLSMTVLPSGSIVFRLIGGEEKVWTDYHINDYSHTFTETQAFYGNVFCGICGNSYHHVNSGNRWSYWYDTGRKHKGSTCTSPNFSDYKLRQITAMLMKMPEFDEAAFTEQIDSITVLEDGGIALNYKDGRKKEWHEQ